LPGELVGLRELVLLTWLRHVEANLSKSTRYFAIGYGLRRILRPCCFACENQRYAQVVAG